MEKHQRMSQIKNYKQHQDNNEKNFSFPQKNIEEKNLKGDDWKATQKKIAWYRESSLLPFIIFQTITRILNRLFFYKLKLQG